jgi:hypothetical protein
LLVATIWHNALSQLRLDRPDIAQAEGSLCESSDKGDREEQTVVHTGICATLNFLSWINAKSRAFALLIAAFPNRARRGLRGMHLITHATGIEVMALQTVETAGNGRTVSR